MTLEAKSKNVVDEAPLSIQHFLDFGISISGRLNDIHNKNLIHGDIRPENISWDSKAKICELTEPVRLKDNYPYSTVLAFPIYLLSRPGA